MSEIVEDVIILKNENETNEIVTNDHTETIDEDSVSVHSGNNDESDHHDHTDNDNDENGDDNDNDDDDDDASVVLEREEGDGQESTPNRKVDDDEDKRNPQYIPKRGTFYEHDDRTAAEETADGVIATDASKPVEKELKKKVWSEKESSSWSHDRYNDQEQIPKTKQELISIYGYDIRNEEGPPRARRRRRYGRGPNKYTRNWEDEEAYGIPTNDTVSTKSTRRNKHENNEKTEIDEFPPLVINNTGSQSSEQIPEVTDTKSVDKNSVSTQSNNDNNFNNNYNNNNNNNKKNRKSWSGENGPRHRVANKQDARNAEIDDEQQISSTSANQKNYDTRGITRTRGFKSGGRPRQYFRPQNIQNHYAENSTYIMSQNFTNKSQQHHHQPQQQHIMDLEKDLSNMNLQQQQQQQSNEEIMFNRNRMERVIVDNGDNQLRQSSSMPPRLQGTEQRAGPKRYSSLRQRSLPETVPNFEQQQQQPPPPPPPQHMTYYQTDYSQQSSSGQGGPPPTQPQQAAMISAAQPPPQYAQAPPPPQPPPPQFAPPPVAAAAYLQAAAVAQMMNYGQPAPPPPPQFTPQPTGYTNYPHQQFNPVNQPQQAEMFHQSQNGITYYSPQLVVHAHAHAHTMQQQLQQKRRTAAIPIVPPPPEPISSNGNNQPRGRGRLTQAEGCSPPPGGAVVTTTSGESSNSPPPLESGTTVPLVIQQ